MPESDGPPPTPAELEPPRAKAQPATRASHELTQSYEEISTSPIPAPRMLAEYEAVKPGLAAEVIGFIEREQAHRHQFENKLLAKQSRESLLGQWLAFGLGIAGFASACFFIANDEPIAATIVACTLIVGLIIRGVIRVSYGDKTAEIDMSGQQQKPEKQSTSKAPSRKSPRPKKR